MRRSGAPGCSRRTGRQHDDVGWLNTVDEYYVTQVRWILNTALTALRNNPARKFTCVLARRAGRSAALPHRRRGLSRTTGRCVRSYVEQAYFQRWWEELSVRRTQPGSARVSVSRVHSHTQRNTVRGHAQSAERNDVRRLVANGQLEFNLGGLCMNDEASPHYESEIAQMTEGMQFILREFGPNARPRVGWHIDPFGHSSATASMWSLMGLDTFSPDRIDFRLKSALQANRSLEFIWRGNPTLGAKAEIFTHVIDEGFYCTPGECNYDGGLWINTNARLPTLAPNYVQQGEDFVNMARRRRQWYRHNYVLVPFGCDFAHQDAERSFIQMDQLISYVNSNKSLNAHVQYSTLGEYTRLVNALNLTWPVFTGDFFPYADNPHVRCAWFRASRTMRAVTVPRTRRATGRATSPAARS